MKINLLIVNVIVFQFLFSNKININLSTMDDLSNLPITEDQKIALFEQLVSRGYFLTIYDLLEIPEFTPADIHKLKQYIIVEPPKLTDVQEKISRNTYKLENWLASDGSSEGLSEVWLDRFYEPMNVNEMNYDDLMLLPTITPIDANAVILQKQRGEIKGTFELKNSPNISYYGYKNLRDFVLFSPPKNDSNFHFRISNLLRTVPITTNPDDEGTIIEFSGDGIPETLTRISIRYGKHLKIGTSYHRNRGESIFSEKLLGSKDITIPKMKYSISLEKVQFPYLRLDRIVFGNFTVSFNQGVVFESTDYFSPRRTGYMWTKRTEGIHPDLSRSSQYVMNGVGLQVSNQILRGALFISANPRDAIINNDATDTTKASFSTMIVMQPRLPFGAYSDTNKVFNEITESVKEVTWGGNLRFTPKTGLNFGMTFYESLYDRVIDPQIKESITGGPDPTYSGDDRYLQYMSNSADPEIAAMYSSAGESPLWDEALSFRRVIGFDFSYIYKNLAIQAEYGELTKEDDILKLGNEPHGLVVNTYIQFDNLNLLALYRDYSLDYDNPYQRSYSNYQRYKTSIFEDIYWLEDPVYGYLYSGNPQPQAERGLFLSSRYQFHRSMVGTLNWDTWTRVADNTKYYRTVANIEFRPVFNYRIKIRQKFQGRGAFDVFHPSPFDSRETRVTVRLRLSRYDQLELLYSDNFTRFSPRPRLTKNAETGVAWDMMTGDIGSADETLGFIVTHNFSNNFKMKGSILYIDGFFWNFEDTDFRIFDTPTQSFHSWLSFVFHLGNNLSVRYKISHTTDYPLTNIVPDATDIEDYDGTNVEFPYVLKDQTDFRLQVDYVF